MVLELASAPPRTRLLIIDHMALVRRWASQAFAHTSTIEVVATAANACLARRKILATRPDVILLDLQPPIEPDLACLEEILAFFRIPIVLLTSLQQTERRAAIEALTIRRSLVLDKPESGLVGSLSRLSASAGTLIRRAHLEEWQRWQSKRRRRLDAPARPGPEEPRIIAIGASTGGTEAIAEMLSRLPRATPGMVIVQHMPIGFTRMFAERLDALSELEVKEAEDGDLVRPGRALIAPGGRQMRVVAAAGGYRVRIESAPRVSRHCPSVDVLMRSVADQARGSAVGIILTGMGDDGAEGMQRLRAAGAVTFAQDQGTSVVFGMPKAAYDRGGVDRLLPLGEIPRELLSAALRR